MAIIWRDTFTGHRLKNLYEHLNKSQGRKRRRMWGQYRQLAKASDFKREPESQRLDWISFFSHPLANRFFFLSLVTEGTRMANEQSRRVGLNSRLLPFHQAPNGSQSHAECFRLAGHVAVIVSSRKSRPDFPLAEVRALIAAQNTRQRISQQQQWTGCKKG